MSQSKTDAVIKVLNVVPLLAPDIASAIITIMHSPAMSKEELLQQAEDLDNATLAFIEQHLAD